MIVRFIDPIGVTHASLEVEIAATDRQRVKGLAGRPGVPPGTGMLFIFSQDTTIPFTVTQMLVPIDFFWFSSAGDLVGVRDRVVPGSVIVSAPRPYRYVLEAAAGTWASLGNGPWRVSW